MKYCISHTSRTTTSVADQIRGVTSGGYLGGPIGAPSTISHIRRRQAALYVYCVFMALGAFGRGSEAEGGHQIAESCQLRLARLGRRWRSLLYGEDPTDSVGTPDILQPEMTLDCQR